MNFRSRHRREEPEINFIPLIDLLLVILIFLTITTTYNRLNGLRITLPAANAAPMENLNRQDIVLAVAPTGWQIGQENFTERTALQSALSTLAQQHTGDNAWVIIYANADTPYQRVIDAMQAAQAAGLTHITMATYTPSHE